LPINISDLSSEPPLAEIVIVGRRRLVIGEIENADIDGGHDDMRLLAGRKTRELYRYADRGIGPQRCRQRHVER
jgi:hypothetical protein